MGKPKRKYYSEGVLVCDTIQDLIDEIKKIGIYSAEVPLYDKEFIKVVKIIESTTKTY